MRFRAGPYSHPPRWRRLATGTTLLLLSLSLSSCADLASPGHTSGWVAALVGSDAVLARELHLYGAAPHQFDFTPFVLSRGKQSVPAGRVALLTYLETWPAGKPVRITAVKTVRKGGERWSVILGEGVSSVRGESVAFEYLVGIASDPSPIPFRPAKKE